MKVLKAKEGHELVYGGRVIGTEIYMADSFDEDYITEVTAEEAKLTQSEWEAKQEEIYDESM